MTLTEPHRTQHPDSTRDVILGYAQHYSWFVRPRLMLLLYHADYLAVKQHGEPLTDAIYAPYMYGPYLFGLDGVLEEMVADGALDSRPQFYNGKAMPCYELGPDPSPVPDQVQSVVDDAHEASKDMPDDELVKLLKASEPYKTTEYAEPMTWDSVPHSSTS